MKKKELKSVVREMIEKVNSIDKRLNELEQDKFAELKEDHKNGAVIEWKSPFDGKWREAEYHLELWDNGTEYRIKPEEKPNVGDVCKFWDVDEDIFVIGKLKSIDTESKYKFVIADITNAPYYFINAKTITQQEAIDLLFNK